MKTPEQILNEHDLNFDWMTSKSYKNIIIACMEEYASQFHPSPEIPEISDEEIEKEFPTDPKIIATNLKIPERLFSQELWEVLTKFVEANENKRIAAKFVREWYRKLREGGKKDDVDFGISGGIVDDIKLPDETDMLLSE